MPHFSENIRLRVSLSTSMKFYISIQKKAELSELKAIVKDILLKVYSSKIANFTVRSDDGYEILPYFPMGEVLSDNQLLCIDMMQLERHVCGESADAPCLAENNFKGQSPVSGERGRAQGFEASFDRQAADSNKSILSFYKNNESYLKQKDESVQLNSASLKKKTQNRTDGPITNSESTGPQAQGPCDTSNKASEAGGAERAGLGDVALRQVRAEAPAKTKAEDVQFDNKFKGFVVKKKDLEKSRNMNFMSSSAFKPLKKRKQEEVFEPI